MRAQRRIDCPDILPRTVLPNLTYTIEKYIDAGSILSWPHTMIFMLSCMVINACYFARLAA